mmetsp:Transcript_25961/g.55571  ORF Transcript_25961/g.55571 Transcript_25961/m.55571 type:complete len:319 (+) Transcript_25961:736-1692(+)
MTRSRGKSSCSAMAYAVRLLSPVTIQTSIPSFSRYRTVWWASVLISSAMPRTAHRVPLIPARIAVLPCSSSFCMHASTSEDTVMSSRSANARLPIATCMLPLITPEAPRPVIATKSEGWTNGLDRSNLSIFCSENRTIAVARMCSEFRSNDPNSHTRKSSVDISGSSSMDRLFMRSRKKASDASLVKSVTAGLPLVRVPVLSKSTALAFDATSRVSPPFMRIPWLAPTPVPTMTAVGVARPRAHGQLMTRDAMPNIREKAIGFSSPYQPLGTKPVLQHIHHTKNVKNEKRTTTGTKIEAIESASFCMGTCFDCASCTI